MARIPEEEIERIKREVSLVSWVEARGVALKPHGENWVGLCPFHEDREPSLIITPSKNLWHCMGACNAGGSVIDWVMKTEGASFRRAVDLLRNFVGSNGSHYAEPTRENASPAEGVPSDLSVEDQALLLWVVAHYHETLKSHPEAQGYLKKRGLDSVEMIEHFQIGFSNGTLKDCLPKEDVDRLTRLGVIRYSGHEHLAASIVIPIFDGQGGVVGRNAVCGMYGRKISKPRAGYPKHLYLPGPHKGVWNFEVLAKSSEIIVCEALMDALTFWRAGYHNVIASYGVNGFTEDHFSALRGGGTKRVLIAYDRDHAGEKASASLAEQLARDGIDCLRIQFPKGMDANDYALKVQPAEKSLGLLISSAVWIGKGNMPCEGKAQESAPPEAVVEREGMTTPVAGMPPTANITAEVTVAEVVIPIGDRRYRVRGLSKNMSYEQLKVNIFVARGETFYIDTLDIYAARARATYIKEATRELGIEEPTIKKDIGHILLKLEELQDQQIKEVLCPKEKSIVLNEADTATAMDFLKDPKLLDRILSDFTRCGVVGEETNKLVGYLAGVSRKLSEPLAVIIQSSTAAGKTSLMEAILAMMPEEDRVKYSAMTGQSLFYMEGVNLKHKILAIVEEQGAQRASYALKLLQSEGELTIASTGKDANTGRLVTHAYKVEGPVMIFLTTTAIEIDEELLNRCLVLSVNEDREQTRAIHRLQREKHTLEGLLVRQDREAILKVHQNAQRLLRPLSVVNPYARRLTFIDDRTRTRRDHLKYLTLIDTIALLHQYQRPIKENVHHGKTISYIEVTVNDIAVANELAHAVLGRTLDELLPQARRLLMLIDQRVREACVQLKMDRADYRFSRKEVRLYTGWSDFQIKAHMRKLEDLEYVLVHRGGRGQSFVYELLYDGKGQDGQPFLMGLIDVETLQYRHDSKKEYENCNLEWSSSPQGDAKEHPSRLLHINQNINTDAVFRHFTSESSKKTYIRGGGTKRGGAKGVATPAVGVVNGEVSNAQAR